jgi:hypothetical protein
MSDRGFSNKKVGRNSCSFDNIANRVGQAPCEAMTKVMSCGNMSLSFLRRQESILLCVMRFTWIPVFTGMTNAGQHPLMAQPPCAPDYSNSLVGRNPLVGFDSILSHPERSRRRHRRFYYRCHSQSKTGCAGGSTPLTTTWIWQSMKSIQKSHPERSRRMTKLGGSTNERNANSLFPNTLNLNP